MAYKGGDFPIDCGKGGYTGNRNIEGLAPEMMVWPTRNINLQNGGRERRGGSAHVYVTAFHDAPYVTGIYDFMMNDGTQYLITATKDGKIWKDGTNEIKTGMSTTTFFSFETGDNELFIADGITMPQVWPGTGNAAEISNPAADWTTKKPFQFVKHGRWNSERMWAITRTGIYGSSSTNFQDFSTANVIYIPLDTTDGHGLQGAAVLGGRLIIFGKTKSFILEDTDTDTNLWGYTKAPWDGGVANFRLIIKSVTDLACMTEEGEIYSVSAAQSAGDYEQASIARPSWIHTWIQDRVNLSCIGNFHGVYDPVMDAIKIFFTRKGQLTNDSALVYFVDRGTQEGWMVHDNQAFVSGYSAVSSAVIRKGIGDYKVYTGDYAGFVWELETAARDDNANTFEGKFTTPIMNLGDPTIYKHFHKLRIIGNKESTAGTLTIAWWVDDVAQTSLSASLSATASYIDVGITLGKVGKRIQFAISNNVADKAFFIDKLIIYLKPMGKGNK